MNEKQRQILVISTVIVVAMLFFPPLEIRGFSLGYGCLLSRDASVDIGVLFAQWVAVAVVTAVLWVLRRGDS